MPTLHPRRPSAGLVVAVVALVVALSGTAVAGQVAHVARTLINGSSIRRGSIPANRLERHSITARQINEAKLGTLPHAALADDASNLDGQPASAFLPASAALRWSYTAVRGSASHVVGALGPLTFTATCTDDAGKTDAKLAVTTSESATAVTDTPEDLPGPNYHVLNAGDAPYTVVAQDSKTANDGNSTAFGAFDAAGQLATFTTAQTIGVAINTGGNANCRFFGLLLNDA